MKLDARKIWDRFNGRDKAKRKEKAKAKAKRRRVPFDPYDFDTDDEAWAVLQAHAVECFNRPRLRG